MPTTGGTIRSMLDWIIAAAAIDEDIPVLHADADFALLVRDTGLARTSSGSAGSRVPE